MLPAFSVIKKPIHHLVTFIHRRSGKSIRFHQFPPLRILPIEGETGIELLEVGTTGGQEVLLACGIPGDFQKLVQPSFCYGYRLQVGKSLADNTVVQLTQSFRRQAVPPLGLFVQTKDFFHLSGNAGLITQHVFLQADVGRDRPSVQPLVLTLKVNPTARLHPQVEYPVGKTFSPTEKPQMARAGNRIFIDHQSVLQGKLSNGFAGAHVGIEIIKYPLHTVGHVLQVPTDDEFPIGRGSSPNGSTANKPNEQPWHVFHHSHTHSFSSFTTKIGEALSRASFMPI